MRCICSAVVHRSVCDLLMIRLKDPIPNLQKKLVMLSLPFLCEENSIFSLKIQFNFASFPRWNLNFEKRVLVTLSLSLENHLLKRDSMFMYKIFLHFRKQFFFSIKTFFTRKKIKQKTVLNPEFRRIYFIYLHYFSQLFLPQFVFIIRGIAKFLFSKSERTNESS